MNWPFTNFHPIALSVSSVLGNFGNMLEDKCAAKVKSFAFITRFLVFLIQVYSFYRFKTFWITTFNADYFQYNPQEGNIIV